MGATQRCKVTHPFHPRRGEELEYFEYRRDWSGQRVYFHDESGCLTSMPAEWTSVVPPHPLQVIGEGRARFRLDDLLGLCELLEWIRSSGHGQGVER
jgi:hypothetical protein